MGAIAPGPEPGLHDALILALERVGGDASVLAHHCAAAGDDDERVLVYAPRAAEQAARTGAHREAVSFYGTALRFAEHGRTPTAAADLAALLETFADEQYVTDHIDDAIATGRRALDLRLRLGEPVAIGLAHRALAQFYWYAADRPAADRHDRAAIEILAGHAGSTGNFPISAPATTHLGAIRSRPDPASSRPRNVLLRI